MTLNHTLKLAQNSISVCWALIETLSLEGIVLIRDYVQNSYSRDQSENQGLIVNVALPFSFGRFLSSTYQKSKKFFEQSRFFELTLEF